MWFFGKNKNKITKEDLREARRIGYEDGYRDGIANQKKVEVKNKYSPNTNSSCWNRVFSSKCTCNFQRPIRDAYELYCGNCKKPII